MLRTVTVTVTVNKDILLKFLPSTKLLLVKALAVLRESFTWYVTLRTQVA